MFAKGFLVILIIASVTFEASAEDAIPEPQGISVCKDIECYVSASTTTKLFGTPLNKTCQIHGAKHVLSVDLQKEYNILNKCKLHTSYGAEGSHIWVSNQCAGKFKVCFEKESNDTETAGDACKGACGQNAFCKGRRGCQCEAGYEGDGINCVGMCMCTGKGDPHYSQFDITDKKDIIHFQGACKYLLSQLNSTERPECNFRVEVKNENRDGDYSVSFARLVDVFVGTDRLTLGPGTSLKINGVSSNTPYSGKGYMLEYSDQYLVVKTACNNEIGFNGYQRVYVMAAKEFGNDLVGICGNCNSELDDCVKPNGEVIPLVDGRFPRLVFGRSWSVPDDTEPEMETCDIEDVELPCTEETLTKASDIGLCGILDVTNNGSIFKKEFEKQGMLPEVTLYSEMAFDDCVFDTCRNLENDGDGKDTVCGMVQSFANDVEEQLNLEVPAWRTNDFCTPDCGENEQFYETTLCERTCSDVNNNILCTNQTDAGCGCKNGYVRSGTTCVNREQSCGCTHTDGKYYQLNELVVSSDCTSEYECRQTNGIGKMVLSRTLERCLENLAECKPSDDGQYGCSCKEGFVGDGVTSCLRGCGPDNMQCHTNATCHRSNLTNSVPSCKCSDGLEGDGVLRCAEMCTCSQWGDPHTTLFDGQRIDFQGRCSYLLTDINVTPDCELRVEVKNVKWKNKETVSSTRVFYVQVGGDTIKVERRKRQVYRNGLVLYGDVDSSEGLPYTVIDDGVYVIVENKCGMSAGFDGRSTGFVRIPREYGLQAKGICGNCDGIQNDYVTSAGEEVSSNPNRDSAIGDSYLVPSESIYEGIENCDTSVDTPEECDADVKDVAKTQCGYLLNSAGPFSECLKQHGTDAQNIFEDCVYDYCAFDGNTTDQIQAVCSAIGKLNDICVENFEVRSWRNSTFCSAKEFLGCDPSKHLRYNSAMSACRATCQYQTKRKRCRQVPMEGCECDRDDYFYDNGRCVPNNECGCIRRVRGGDGLSKKEYYPIGTYLLSENCKTELTCVHEDGRSYFKAKRLTGCIGGLETCHIKDGGYQCTCKYGYEFIDGQCVQSCNGVKCHENGRCSTRNGCVCKSGFTGDGVNTCYSRGDRCKCSAAGDPHYKTFDSNQMMHFMGVCKYTLSLLNDTVSDCMYNVEVQNERRLGKTYPSYTEYVDIEFRGYIVRLGKGGRVFVDGQEEATPYEIDGLFKIIRDGRWVSMETVCKQQFRFNGDSTVQIDVPKPNRTHDYVGICGNCDGKDNDWITRDGTNVAKLDEHARHAAFGNGWLVSDDTGFTPKKCLKDLTEEPTCSSKDKKTASRNNMCGVMLNREGPFRDCLELPEIQDVVAGMFDSCVEDVCLTSGSSDAQVSVMCEMSAMLAETCNEAGVSVQWRSSNFCPLDCSRRHMRYESEILGCPETCQGFTSCEETPSEGCVCEQGFVLSDQKCVKKEQCGCTYTERKRGQRVTVYVKLGGTRTTKNCVKQTCVYVDGESIMQAVVGLESCNETTSQCILDGGSYKCVCKEGYEGVSGYQCQSVTTEVLLPCVPAPEPTLPPKPEGIQAECISSDDPKGLLYWGTHNTTTSGRRCQLWMEQYPHPNPYEKILASEENFCRNRPLSGIIGEKHPWCFTTDRNHEWEYCDIPSCDGPAPATPPAIADRGCYKLSDGGTSYEGPISSTYEGEVCDSWSSNGYSYDDNYCRNPVKEGEDREKDKPWCFVDDVRRDCDVPVCFAPPAEDTPLAYCEINIHVNVCLTVTTMSGNCKQGFSFPGKCVYTVQQVNKKTYQLYLISDEEVVELYLLGKSKHISGTCGTFEFVDNKLSITSHTCGMCMQSSSDPQAIACEV